MVWINQDLEVNIKSYQDIEMYIKKWKRKDKSGEEQEYGDTDDGI